jgi:CheY-like chemotaxis protein
MLGGHIKVTSQEGQGSQFAVYMPYIEATNKQLLINQSQVDEELRRDLKPNLDVPELSGHILCADDNDDNRQLVAYLVAKTGAQLTLVEDGIQAINVAKNGKFDLGVMDMQMPEMDGLQATTILKKRGFKAPIIMLTANVDSNSKKKMLAAGAKAHFAKPIDSQSFYAMLVEYLCDEQGQVKDDGEGDKTAVENKSLTKFHNNSSEFEQLIQNYRLSFKNKLTDIQTAIEQENWGQVKSLMHKLKGSAGSYGFQQLSDFAILVEEHIDQDNLKEAKRYVVDMQACMLQLYIDTETPTSKTA